MKYEKIDRTLEETIEFCDKLAWSLAYSETDLLLSKIGVEQYLDEHRYQKPKAEKFVDFFFRKVEEFEEGQWCWFYDDNFSGGTLARYNYYTNKNNSYICKEMVYGCKLIWDNCISIEEFRERLKEYL